MLATGVFTRLNGHPTALDNESEIEGILIPLIHFLIRLR